MNFDPMDPDPKKWNCALNLFIESLHKVDHELRSRAKNADVYHELMWIRNEVDSWVREKRLEE
jgi:hypothetical protein